MKKGRKKCFAEAAKQICLKGATTAQQPRDAAEKPQQGQK